MARALDPVLFDQERHPTVTDVDLVAHVELGQYVETFDHDALGVRSLVEAFAQLDLVADGQRDRGRAE